MLNKSGAVSVLAEVRDCLHEHLLHIFSSLTAIEISRKQVSMNFASPLFQALSKLHNSHNLYTNYNPAMHQLLACHLPVRFKVSSVVRQASNTAKMHSNTSHTSLQQVGNSLEPWYANACVNQRKVFIPLSLIEL